MYARFGGRRGKDLRGSGGKSGLTDQRNMNPDDFNEGTNKLHNLADVFINQSLIIFSF